MGQGIGHTCGEGRSGHTRRKPEERRATLMGTSRGYTAPTNGNWPRLKREVTRFGVNGSEAPDPEGRYSPTLPALPAAGQLLASYIRTYGGTIDLRQGLSGGGIGSA